MSSINGVSGSGTELSQLRQQLLRPENFQARAGRASDAQRAELDAKFIDAAVAAGLDPTDVATFSATLRKCQPKHARLIESGNSRGWRNRLTAIGMYFRS